MIVDAAVVDVSSFAKRHPGGARLIINCVGTDVTSEIIGEDASIANSGMFFAPHHHTDVSSAVGSEAGVVKRRIRMIGGGLGATLRTVDRLVPSRLYRAALWTFPAATGHMCSRGNVAIVLWSILDDALSDVSGPPFRGKVPLTRLPTPS